MDLSNTLYEKFQLRSFRIGQKEIITDLLNNKNVLAMLPTGSGKSLCYQLPAFILEGMTIVVSPLLSLMEDQVQQLKSQGFKGVVGLNSFLPLEEREWILLHLYKQKIVYVSPESLQSKYIMRQLKKCRISLFVVDEAHCISQWGHEFRTDYLKLAEVRRELGNPPCLAITATATKEVQLDIVQMLNLSDYRTHIYSIDRPNIATVIKKCSSSLEEKTEELISLVKNLQGPGIIYASTRKWTEDLARILVSNGIKNVSYYHGGMTNDDRILIQQQFINNELQLICCTSAFGMGVNKPDIRYVIHFHFPLQLESYLQEIGRAGRDGEESIAITLFNEDETVLQYSLLTKDLPNQEQLNKVLNFIRVSSNQDEIQEKELIQVTGITEVMWRFIRFHLEANGVIEDHKFKHIKDDQFIVNLIFDKIEKRIRYKQKKLIQFQQWLNESNICRRELILKHFDDQLTKKPNSCCDNCGIDLKHYYQTNGHSHNSDDFFTSWQDELKKVFHQQKRMDEEDETGRYY